MACEFYAVIMRIGYVSGTYCKLWLGIEFLKITFPDKDDLELDVAELRQIMDASDEEIKS